MSKANYWENTSLDLALRDVPAGFTRTSATRYISLHTADPGEDGTTAEASGSNYARAQKDAGNTNWSRTNNTVTNASAITFAQLNGSLGPITHFAIWDAVSGGNCLYKGAFGTSRSFISGDTPTINTGGLSITEE